MPTPIAERIRQDLNPAVIRLDGPVAALAGRYQPRGPRLLGFLLKLGYEEMTIVTNDVFKANCDGVPRNSFVIVKLVTHSAKGITDRDFALARKIEDVISWQPGREGGPLEGTPNADQRFRYIKYDG